MRTQSNIQKSLTNMRILRFASVYQPSGKNCCFEMVTVSLLSRSPRTIVVIKSSIYRFDRCGKFVKLMLRSPDLLITRRGFCGRRPVREHCVSMSKVNLKNNPTKTRLKPNRHTLLCWN